MGANTKIEWCDYTFNAWTGCTKVSPGCANCYAETLARRAPKTFGGWGPGAPRRLTSDAYWKQPLRWDRSAAAEGSRPRVFCASLADWLDPEVLPMWRAELFDVIRKTPNLDWLLLTKRPEKWNELLVSAWTYADLRMDDDELCSWIGDWTLGRAPANVWVGTTVEDQTRADERIPQLLRIPSRVRFLSCEPLLGPVDLRRAGALWSDMNGEIRREYQQPWQHVDWVICGGESGPKARPMDLAWARSLRDQCAAAGVAFFMKQMGAVPMEPEPSWRARVDENKPFSATATLVNASNIKRVPGEFVPIKFNDRAGGDMAEWPEDLRVRQFPEVRHA